MLLPRPAAAWGYSGALAVVNFRHSAPQPPRATPCVLSSVVCILQRGPLPTKHTVATGVVDGGLRSAVSFLVLASHPAAMWCLPYFP